MLKTLLIHNDPNFIKYLNKMLDLSNIDIQVTQNSHNVLPEIIQKKFDFILLDIQLFSLSALELITKIRSQSHIPIFILTHHQEDNNKCILALELGADDYFVIPFNCREFMARINTVLRRINTTNVNNRRINFEELELLLNSQQVIYKDKILKLTETEFIILKLFIENIGKVLSREILSQTILNKPLSLYDRAIDMHISNLRKKLPKRKDNLAWFKTVRGKGYLLIAEKS